MRDTNLMEFGRSTDRESNLRDPEIVRAGANGRFMPDPPEPVEGSDGFRKSSNGRFVGNEIRDPGVKRGPDGRFRGTTNAGGRVEPDDESMGGGMDLSFTDGGSWMAGGGEGAWGAAVDDFAAGRNPEQTWADKRR